MYNARLTGASPRVQVDDSNFKLLLGGSNPAGDYSISLLQAGAGVQIGTPLSLSLFAGDAVRARLDVGGMHAGVLTADTFTNLLDTRESTSVVLPPTANALNDAYITLSNMIVMGYFSGGSNLPTDTGTLLDTYTSTSVLNAPTANALRGAYYNLSNLLTLKLRDLGTATTSASSNYSGSGSNVLDNDLWILSQPDGAPRFYFATDATSTFAASASAVDGYAFRWTWNEMAEDVMRYRVQPEKRLEVLGGLDVLGGSFSACNSATVAGTLALRDGGRLRLGDGGAPGGGGGGAHHLLGQQHGHQHAGGLQPRVHAAHQRADVRDRGGAHAL